MAYCKDNCVFEFSVFILNQKVGTMLLLIWYPLVIWKRHQAKEVAQHYSEVFPDSSSRKSIIEESVVYKHLLACLAFHVIVEIQFSISLSHLVVHWEMVYVRIPRPGQTKWNGFRAGIRTLLFGTGAESRAEVVGSRTMDLPVVVLNCWLDLGKCKDLDKGVKAGGRCTLLILPGQPWSSLWTREEGSLQVWSVVG